MKKVPFETKFNGEDFYCLSNDWKEGDYRYSLELSKTETPENTILVVGVNPGGKTDPEVPFIGATVRKHPTNHVRHAKTAKWQQLRKSCCHFRQMTCH